MPKINSEQLDGLIKGLKEAVAPVDMTTAACATTYVLAELITYAGCPAEAKQFVLEQLNEALAGFGVKTS